MNSDSGQHVVEATSGEQPESLRVQTDGEEFERDRQERKIKDLNQAVALALGESMMLSSSRLKWVL